MQATQIKSSGHSTSLKVIFAFVLSLGFWPFLVLATPPHNDSAQKSSQGLAKDIMGADGAPMVLVPVGEFVMGTNDINMPGSNPAHTVHLDSFYIDTYEVTNLQYATFLKATGRREPKYRRKVILRKPDHRPAVFVSWYDAQAYCEYYDKRLPTEAEWEKAARATDGRKYPWGNEAPTERHVNVGPVDENIYHNLPGRVGSYEAGKSPYGVYDMAGNVGEWVYDWAWRNYDQDGSQNNPKGPSQGEGKMLRGAFFNSDDIRAYSARSDDRFVCPPTLRGDWLGFRCAQAVR